MNVLHWRLLLLERLKNLSLEVKLTALSIIIHLCALFALLVLYTGNATYNITITGSLIDTNIPIVFLPMHKSIKQGSGAKRGTSEVKSGLQNTKSAEPVLADTAAATHSKVTTTLAPNRSNPSTSSGRADKNKQKQKEKKKKANDKIRAKGSEVEEKEES